MNPHAEFNSLFGLHLGLTLGTCPDTSAVNMDANVIAEISTHGGLTRMQFTGDLWGLRGFAERANAPIKGGLRIEYRKDGTGAETVTGNFDVSSIWELFGAGSSQQPAWYSRFPHWSGRMVLQDG
ncbi:MAG: hypothetical protein IPH05_18830 [Flavobacteriales bacterium]|nr:hypothetical protein [Flavobacteriales bacterium]